MPPAGWRLSRAASVRDPPIGVGHDLGELLQGLLESRILATTKHDFFREQQRQVAELEGGTIGNRLVVSMTGVHLPSSFKEAGSPRGSRMIDQLWLGNAFVGRTSSEIF